MPPREKTKDPAFSAKSLAHTRLMQWPTPSSLANSRNPDPVAVASVMNGDRLREIQQGLAARSKKKTGKVVKGERE
jgi:hypothetical protein